MTNKNFDINIEEINKVETHDLEYSSLSLKFTGADVNNILVNTIRRILLNNIPMYAFPVELIQIEKNDSIFNNDQIKLRLSQLPILNTALDLAYIPDKYWRNINLKDPNREKHPKERKIEIYISATNSSERILNVTTNDIKYFEDLQPVENKYNQKFPIVLIQLRPMESFVCRMQASIGTGEKSAIWSSAGNAYFNEHEDGSFTLNIESQGQCDEYELLIKTCKYMREKFNELKNKISTNYLEVSSKNEPIQTLCLTLDNESYTTGGILVDILQNMKDVVFAGFGKKNELVDQITLTVKYAKLTKEPLAAIYDAIDRIMLLSTHLETKINALIKHDMHSVKPSKQTKEPIKKTSKKVSKK